MSSNDPIFAFKQHFGKSNADTVISSIINHRIIWDRIKDEAYLDLLFNALFNQVEQWTAANICLYAAGLDHKSIKDIESLGEIISAKGLQPEKEVETIFSSDINLEQIAATALHLCMAKERYHNWDGLLKAGNFDSITSDGNLGIWGTIFTLIYELLDDKRGMIIDLGNSTQNSAQELLAFIVSANPFLMENDDAGITNWLNEIPLNNFIRILDKAGVYNEIEAVRKLADNYILKNPIELILEDNPGKDPQSDELLKNIALYKNYAILSRFSSSQHLAEEYSGKAFELGNHLNQSLEVLKNQIDRSNQSENISLHDLANSFEPYSKIGKDILDEGLIGKILQAVDLKETDLEVARKLGKQITIDICGSRNLQQLIPNSALGIILQPQQIIELLIELELINEAAQVSKKLLDFQPRNINILKAAAKLNYKFGDYQQAVDYYLQLEVFSSLSREEKVSLADALGKIGDWQNALQEWNGINPVSLDDYQKKAICSYYAGDRACFEATVKTAQGFYTGKGLFQVIQALFDYKEGKFDQAKDLINQVIGYKKRDQSVIKFMLEYHLLASQLDQAQALINSLSSLERSLPEVCLKRYELCERLTDLDGCRKIIENNCQHKNNADQLVVEKLLSRCFKLDLSACARDLLEYYSEKWVLSPDLTDFRARLYLEDGQFAAAKEILKGVIQRDNVKEGWLLDYGLALTGSNRSNFPLKQGIENDDPIQHVTGPETMLFDKYPNSLLLRIIKAELSENSCLDQYHAILADKKFHKDSEIWRVHAGMGKYYYQHKQYDLAIVSFREARKAQPKKKAIELYLINAFAKMRLFDDAISIFTSKRIEDSFSLSELLEINTSLKNSSHWQQILEEIVDRVPGYSAGKIVLAQLNMEKGKSDKVLEIIQSLELTAKDRADESLICTQILIGAKYCEEAKRQLEVLLTSHTDISDEEYLAGAFLYYQINEYHKAANLLNLIKLPDHNVLTLKTDLYLKLDLVQEAQASIQAAIDEFDKKSSSNFIKLNRWIYQPEFWKTVLKDPKWIYLKSIEIKAACQDLQAAMADAEQSINKFPDSLLLKTMTANLANILGNEEITDGLLELLPEDLRRSEINDDICVWSEIALRKGQEILAANQLSQFLEVIPDSMRMQALQARLLARNGNKHDAQALMDKLLSDPIKSDALQNSKLDAYQFWMAEAALDLGMYPAAMKECENLFANSGITSQTAKIFLTSLLNISYIDWINKKLKVTSHTDEISDVDQKYFNDICVITDKKIKDDVVIQNLISNIRVWFGQQDEDFREVLTMRGTNPDSHAMIVSSYFLDGNNKAEIALENDSQDIQAKFLMALLEMESDPEKASVYLTEFIRKMGNHPKHYAALAFIKKNQGQLDDAYAAINLALAEWPEEYKWQILAGELSKDLGDMHTSLAHFQKASEIHQDENTQAYLGELNLQAENQYGISYLERKLVGNEQDFESLIKLGELGIKNSKFQKAARYLENARHYKPLDPRSYILMSQVALKVGNQEKAEEIINQALQVKPDDVNVILQKATVMDSSGDINKAMQFIEEYANSLTSIKPEMIIRKADYISALEGNERALAYLLDQSKKVKHASLITEIAKYYLKTGKLYEAEESAEQALQADNENPYILELLAQISSQSGDLDKALDFLVKAIQINPFVPGFYISMAKIYQSRRDLEQAEDLLQSGLRSNPMNFDLLSSLGLLYYQQGLYKKSEQHLRQASSINPYNENIKRLLSTLMNANIIQANTRANSVIQEV